MDVSSKTNTGLNGTTTFVLTASELSHLFDRAQLQLGALHPATFPGLPVTIKLCHQWRRREQGSSYGGSKNGVAGWMLYFLSAAAFPTSCATQLVAAYLNRVISATTNLSTVWHALVMQVGLDGVQQIAIDVDCGGGISSSRSLSVKEARVGACCLLSVFGSCHPSS